MRPCEIKRANAIQKQLTCMIFLRCDQTEKQSVPSLCSLQKTLKKEDPSSEISTSKIFCSASKKDRAYQVNVPIIVSNAMKIA